MSFLRKKPVVVAAILVITSFYAVGQTTETDINTTVEKLNKVSDCSELYKGDNTNLLTGTKCAIAKGNSAGMENTANIVCKSFFREVGCPVQLLQLAYFYFDTTNPERSLEKSKIMVENLVKEYPNWDGIYKAQALLLEIEKLQ